MFHIVLYQPEIPPNTGNILRIAANTGCRLHLVKPLGFRLDDRALARAGMDYAAGVDTRVYDRWEECLENLGPARVFALTTRGARATTRRASGPATPWYSARKPADCPRRCSTACRRPSGCGFRCCRAAAASIWRMRWRW